MPEIQAAASSSWQDAADIQAAATDSWQDATDVQSVGSTYTPPAPGGGTVIVPGSLQPLNDIAPATVYEVTSTLEVLDFRDGSPLPVDAVTVSLQEGSAHWALTATGPGELATALLAGEQPAVVEVRISADVWRFVVDEVDQPLGFASTATSVQGSSLASLAGAPHQVERTWLADSPTTAAQVATVAQTYTGLEVDWRLTDWLIPEGAWSYTGAPFGVVAQMAAAVGADVESHPSEMRVTVKPRYATLPNLWATTRPDWQIAWAAVERASQVRANKPEYDSVVLTGQQAGDVLVARLAGTSGANQAPLISDALLTDVAAMHQRAQALLAGYGKQTRETRMLQVHGRVIQRGELVRNVDPGATWSGVVRGVAVSASLGLAQQTVVMERHTAFTLGTAAPEPIPPPVCLPAQNVLAFSAPFTSDTVDVVGGLSGSENYPAKSSFGPNGLTIAVDDAGYTVLYSSALFNPLRNENRRFSMRCEITPPGGASSGYGIRFFIVGGSTSQWGFSFIVSGGVVSISTYGYNNAGVPSTTIALPSGEAEYTVDFSGGFVNWIVNGVVIQTSAISWWPFTSSMHVGPWNGSMGGVTSMRISSVAVERVPNTLLLARFDGDFADSSSYNRAPTLFGSPAIATSGQRFGTGAGHFDGSSYVRFPANANWSIPGDCTFSFWIKPTSLPTVRPRVIAAWYDPSYSEQLWFRQELDGSIGVGVPGYGGANKLVTAPVAAGELAHIALVRNGTTVKLFARGASLGTTWTTSSNMGHESFAYYIGGTTNANFDQFVGLVDEFEITGGLALWSTEFTPPTAPRCAT